MIIIKKYRNRRFYNSSHSCYIRLPEIQKLVQDGEALQVVSHPGGEDLTTQFLFELVLEKTNFLDSFSNAWLEKLVRVAGTKEEEELLGALKQIVSGESAVEPKDAVELRDSKEEKTEIVEFVEELSKGIPIKLEPEDLLELDWEEHSETEEVAETPISLPNWDDKTAERIEWSSETTVEKIENIPEESEESVVEVIEEVGESLIANQEPKQEESPSIVVDAVEEQSDSLVDIEEEAAAIEEPEIVPAVIEAPRTEEKKPTIQNEVEPDVENVPVLDEKKGAEKALSQKEILQAKLAALKAKLGQG